MSVQEDEIRNESDADAGNASGPVGFETPITDQQGPVGAEPTQGSPAQSASAEHLAGDSAAPETPAPRSDLGAETPEAELGLEEQLALVQADRDQYLDLARRAQADFDNYRKRAAREVADARSRTIATVVRELLPAIDNLERALAAAEQGDSDQLANGVKLVHSDLLSTLQRIGVVAVSPAGELFDPNLHEAISTRPEEGTAAGIVLDIAEKGYMLGETVIRPARVVVSS